MTLGPINELTSATYSGSLIGPDGTAIGSSIIATLTLTLYDFGSGTILNSRDGQNVLNRNDVTFDTAGLLTWHLQPADNAIVGTRELERHVALFTAGWVDTNNQPQQLEHEVVILVTNLRHVSSAPIVAIVHPSGEIWAECLGVSPSRVCTLYVQDGDTPVPLTATTY